MTESDWDWQYFRGDFDNDIDKEIHKDQFLERGTVTLYFRIIFVTHQKQWYQQTVLCAHLIVSPRKTV